MPRKSWVVMTCCLVMGGVARGEAGQPDPNPVVLITVENPNNLAVPNLDRARELAVLTYERAGVALTWSPDETTSPDRTFTIVLTTSRAVPPGLGADAMGVAPSPGDGTRGTVGYVFIDKVTSFAASHRLAVAPVLACAIAHEIGHLLLPPNAHRADGVMRGGWHPALFPPRAPGVPGFPSDQAKLLRLRARRH